jgi:hypothetical protein
MSFLPANQAKDCPKVLGLFFVLKQTLVVSVVMPFLWISDESI